jgi:hypothetical protein
MTFCTKFGDNKIVRNLFRPKRRSIKSTPVRLGGQVRVEEDGAEGAEEGLEQGRDQDDEDYQDAEIFL